MACAVQDKEPEGVVVATSSDGEMATECWKPEGAKTESAADVMGARQKRIDAASRVALSFDPAVVLGRHTVEETQEELQLGFDSLVVAGSLDVKLLVLPLLRLLKPSSPLVVYSLTPAPLLELQGRVCKTGKHGATGPGEGDGSNSKIDDSYPNGLGVCPATADMSLVNTHDDGWSSWDGPQHKKGGANTPVQKNPPEMKVEL